LVGVGWMGGAAQSAEIRRQKWSNM